MDLVTAILPLVGVALGALIPLIGVIWTTKATKAQAEQQRQATLREERKAAIIAFLREAQSCENFLSRLWHNASDLPQGVDLARETTRINTEVWLLHRTILLLAATENLRDASEAYARRLDDAMYVEQPDYDSIWDFVRERRNNFLSAARDDLVSAR